MRFESSRGIVALAIACFCSSGCPKSPGAVVLPPPKAVASGDAVRAGDTLSITVRGQDDLSGEYTVSAAGAVRFPRVGDISAAQRAPAEVARDLEAALADGWLRDPQVTVSVLERQNPAQVTVLGEVETAGSYPHDGQLTLMQAISLAGGLTDLAQLRRVKLIRETASGRKTVEINVQAILESRAQDVPIEPGDIIMVPESRL